MSSKNQTALAVIFIYAACTSFQSPVGASVVLDDLHSRLNQTQVAEVVTPITVDEVQDLVRRAGKAGMAVSISGGRHAMGGQQFGQGNLHLDMTAMKRVLAFDAKKGTVEAEAGITWPDLIAYLHEAQKDSLRRWAIRQKQTGADRLTLGGAVSANVHGRGLTLPPFISDIVSFKLVNAAGQLLECSRTQNAELFRLATGGYGLFGVITSVKIKLASRVKLERRVEMIQSKDLARAFQRRIAEGYLYGDFQYNIDPRSRGFMMEGIFSCYRPVDDATPMPSSNKALSLDAWRNLAYLAHHDKRRAFDEYKRHYLSTDKQLYWSDTHSLSVYDENYHTRAEGSAAQSSEMISELYVPRAQLFRFLKELRKDFIRHDVNVIYGTIRVIEEDDESFLRWAKKPWACVIVNLHVEHDAAGLEKAKTDFRRLIDRALSHGGAYYLTYHRWATQSQLEKAYPEFPGFMQLKRKYDPDERFQSEWYRHYRAMYRTSSTAANRRSMGL